LSRFAFTIATPAILEPWLAARLPDVEVARIAELIAMGCLGINGIACYEPDRLLQPGDRLKLKFPAAPVLWTPEAIDLAILYEDNQLIILNKSAGQVIHPAPGHPSGTLANGLLAHCPWPDTQGRPGIIHRLDRDTSGAIVFAKTTTALGHLHHQFKTKTAQRHYLGLVEGLVRSGSGTIDQPIGQHPDDRHRYAIIDEDHGGRSAITHWRVRARFVHNTLVEFHLETGRSHQIRVHCAAIGHPLVGDRLYGAKPTDAQPTDIPPPDHPGQHLHAWTLRLQHPETGQPIDAIAPPPIWIDSSKLNAPYGEFKKMG
jgi:23S rRNA pseudouridine1911/1915/1917 synthase